VSHETTSANKTGFMLTYSESPPDGPKLGRLPAKSDTRALMFSRFAAPPKKLPARTNFWPRRRAFPLRTFGNTQYGDCTRAKQAVAAMRMERLETRRTPQIDDAEVIRVYVDMSNRLYGGGDNGAYETDALSEWRRPELTFKDTKGRALTIDAFLRLNPFDHEELKSALVAAGAHGVAVCLNLPAAWQNWGQRDWDTPILGPLIGNYLPGSWGGHSMWARDYDEVGLWLNHTWGMPDQRITWRAAAAYLDEAHSVIDSWNYWKAKKPEAKKLLDLAGIRKAVNAVSSQKIA
jgi:hypothetical protein